MSKFFCEHKFSFLQDKYQGVELLGHMVSVYLTLQGTAKLFQNGCPILHPYWQCMRVSCSASSPAFGIIIFNKKFSCSIALCFYFGFP